MKKDVIFNVFYLMFRQYDRYYIYETLILTFLPVRVCSPGNKGPAALDTTRRVRAVGERKLVERRQELTPPPAQSAFFIEARRNDETDNQDTKPGPRLAAAVQERPGRERRRFTGEAPETQGG
jgi:hypothetical protein